MRTATDVPLAELTTLRLGGPARTLVEARDQAELIDAVTHAEEPVLVLAGGSNVVIADDGFDGTVVRVATRGIEEDELPGGRVRLTVEAGEPWEELVAKAVAEDLAGFESLAGIPGSTGATPIQNVGAYGQEVADTIASVRALDRTSGEVRDLAPQECAFAYRTSVFKQQPGRYLVLQVTFDLERSRESRPVRYAELARKLGIDLGERAAIADVREAVLELRRGKGMVVDPEDPCSVSAGSFFTNPILALREFEALQRRAGPDAPPAWPEDHGRVKTSAAWLIQRAGFEPGYGDGTVGISAKHSLALINRGGGTTTELVALARHIAAGVQDAFGVALHPEPVFVGHTW